MAMIEHADTCQYLGPDYDPQTWYTLNPGRPTPYCGHATVEGSSYCAVHHHVVYAQGTALRKRHKDLRKQQSLEDLQQMIIDVAEEIEAEGDYTVDEDELV